MQMLITDIVNINHFTPFARTNEVHRKEISTNTLTIQLRNETKTHRVWMRVKEESTQVVNQVIKAGYYLLRIFKKLRERRLYPKLPMLVSEKKENKEQERLAQAKAKKIEKKKIIAGGPKGI